VTIDLCSDFQKAEHVHQGTNLNKFINQSVYAVIFHLTCDP